MNAPASSIHGLGRLRRAMLALGGTDTIAYDRLCRDRERWPLHFDMCLEVGRLADSELKAALLRRLTRPEPAAAIVAPKMERAVSVALAACSMPAAARDEAEDAARPPSEMLLQMAFEQNDPVPSALACCARVSLPILLVRWDRPASERGLVADLTVWALPTWRTRQVEFHAAPASFLLHLDRAFMIGLSRAATAVDRRVAERPPDGLPLLVWDVQPRDALDGPVSTLGIVGPSASAAFALAGLGLLRDDLRPSLRASIGLVDFSRVAVSAGIARDLDSIDAVGGLLHKLGALYQQPLAYGPAPCVFVAQAQQLGRYAAVPERCASIEALVDTAGAATAGRLSEQQRALHDAILRGATGAISEGDFDAVVAEPATSLRTYLLSRYARWALTEFGRLHLNFVNLHLTDLSEQARAGDLTSSRAFGSLAALLRANLHVACFVLTGDPGSGKSTVMRHYEQEQARRALLAIAEGSQDFEVCVWLNLAEYPSDLCTVGAKASALRAAAGDAAATLAAQQLVTPLDWLRGRWQQDHPQMPGLFDLARTCRIRLLADGLNEIAAPDAERWRAAVTGLTESIRDADLWMAAPIFSIRTRESSARLSHPGFAVHQIQLAPWTAAQMRRYVVRRLGMAARPLWRQLVKDKDLLEVCQLPINLAGQTELYAAGLGRAAVSRAELFSGLCWSRLRREYTAGRLDAPGLLSDSDLVALNQEDYWRDHLVDLPSEGQLISGLDRQADAMRRAGTLQVDLRDVAPWIKGLRLREAWIRAVRGLGVAATEVGSRRWSYLHQLWLEFFQARGMTRASPGVAWLADLAPPDLVDLDQVVEALHADEMLPGPGVARLEEPFKLAVQLSSEPARWVREAASINLALAARAAAGCMQRLDPETVRLLKSALLQRSRDPKSDLRLRIEAATELGALGGDDVRFVESRGIDGAFVLPAERCWVRIPAGEYVIGSDERPDESPRTWVSLAAFEMACYPVTNREFGFFVRSGGYEDSRWWVGETSQRWWRGELRNDERITYWRPRFAALREDFDAAVQSYFPGETQGFVDGELRMYASWSEEKAEWELDRRFGARKLRSPGLWRDPQYNQPMQPVAGVSLIEAEAYCAWLSEQCGCEMRLPTEAEWEAAARLGTDGRYPWGDDEPTDRFRINADPAHLRRNSPIGVFPLSDAPTGLVDMVGNVEQLTCSEYRPELQAHALTARLHDGEALRTSRGGNWSEVLSMCRTTTRYWQHPAHRTFRLGFRLVRAAQR